MTKDPTKDLTDGEKLGLILTKLSDVETRLAKLEAQAEDRSRETRPLLDQLIKEMIRTREALTERMDGMDARLERIEKQLKVLTLDVMQVRTDQQRLADDHRKRQASVLR